MDTEITGDSVPDETLTPHAKFARDHWNAKSDDYQAFQKPALAQEPEAWGMLRTPEADLQVLSNVADLDVLDFGCGAAQWSIALALRGARPVGLDLSEQQLAHARVGVFRIRQAKAEWRYLLRDATRRVDRPVQSARLRNRATT